MFAASAAIRCPTARWKPHRARLPRAFGRIEPALALCHRRGCRRCAPRSGNNFAACNAQALAAQSPQRAGLYARLKLAGLEEAPCHFAVFADRVTAQGHGLGRHTMPEMIEYSAVTAVHTIWLAARAQGIGMGWVSILDPKAVASFLTCRRSGNSSAIFVSAFRSRRHHARTRTGGMGATAAAVVGHHQALTG